VDSVHDGHGKRHQPAVRGIPDGQDRPEAEHHRPRAAVRRLVDVDAVRADHVDAVHGQADGRPGQGHVVHGGAGVPGRDSGRGRARRAGQRVHHTAERRFPVRGDHGTARVVRHAERRVGRRPRAVLRHVRLGAGIAVLPVAKRTANGRGRVPAVVQVQRDGRRAGAVSDADERAEGHGEQGDVPRAVHQPEERQGARGRGHGVRRSAGGRHQQPDRLLGADTARARAARRQVRLHDGVRHVDDDGQLRRASPGGQGRPQAAVDILRGVAGRGHVPVRALLLRGGARRRGRGRVRVAAVPVPRAVPRHVLARRRVHPGGVPGRNVPGQRPRALFRHRVHHARGLLVRVQQDIPVRLPQLRVPRHVLGLRGRQRRVRVSRVRIRDRDERQNVPGNPTDPRPDDRTERRREAKTNGRVMRSCRS